MGKRKKKREVGVGEKGKRIKDRAIGLGVDK